MKYLPTYLHFLFLLFITIILSTFLHIVLKNKSIYQRSLIGIDLTILGGFFIIKYNNFIILIISHLLMFIGLILLILADKTSKS